MLVRAVFLLHLVGFAAYLGAGFAQLQLMKRSIGKTGDVRTELEELAAKIIVRIELTPAAKANFGQVAEQTGRTQISTTARLIEWFSGQPDTLQAAILGQYPKELEPAIARLLLDKLPPAPAKAR